jgi:peptide/nickel transport system ATP-binding protein
MAMILVTHDLGVVAGRAHDIAVMYAGQVVEQAAAKTLFSAMRHPYTEALLQSIPKLEMSKHTRLEAIEGRPPDLVNLPHGCKFAPRCKYAQDRCRTEEPELLPDPANPAHLVRCHFPVGTTAEAPVHVPEAATHLDVPVDVVVEGASVEPDQDASAPEGTH